MDDVSSVTVTNELGLPVTADAVVVVPGIMGSELVDAEDGSVRWGLAPKVLAAAWLSGSMPELVVTDEDRAGGGRLRPSRLLRTSAYAPMLGGLEPYTQLLERVEDTVVDRRAVLEFPYDWRLSIEFNAQHLVGACEAHLHGWREVARVRGDVDPKRVRVVIVAHSMGGLIARYASEVLGLSAVLRRIVSLGTPYYGSVKTVGLLTMGAGAPVPRRAARRLARSCPGVYDLLPRYRCVAGSAGLRPLTTADLSGICGDSQLLTESADRWGRLGLDVAAAPATPVSAAVGIEQPTLQSVVIDAGEFYFRESLDGVNHRGDSTVYRQAAAPAGLEAFPLPQKHGTLAKSPEALSFVADKLVGADAGPPLGTRPVGADIPDLVTAGEPIVVRVVGADANPVGVSVRSVELTTGKSTTWPDGKPADGDVTFTLAGLGEGLHRVEVKAGGYSAVSDIVMAAGRS